MKKKFFSYGKPNETALMNWTMHNGEVAENFYKMAVGYRGAAETLVSDLLKDNRDKRADKEVFPLLFLYEQAVELYLKSILIILYRLNGESDSQKVGEKLKKHALQELLEMLYEVVDNVDDKNDCRRALEPLEVYVAERIGHMGADSKEQKQTFFTMRFPADTTLNSYFYVGTYDNVPIDLRYLSDQFEIILDRLDGLQGKYTDMEWNRNN